jgi:hypothetical protein
LLAIWINLEERKKERKRKKNQIKTATRLIGDGCWLAKRWRVRRESLVPGKESSGGANIPRNERENNAKVR